MGEATRAAVAVADATVAEAEAGAPEANAGMAEPEAGVAEAAGVAPAEGDAVVKLAEQPPRARATISARATLVGRGRIMISWLLLLV